MFPSVDDVNYGGRGKVPEAAVDRMVADLEKQYVNAFSINNNLLKHIFAFKNEITMCIYN